MKISEGRRFYILSTFSSLALFGMTLPMLGIFAEGISNHQQAAQEFNKKFRASDEFKKSVPEDKIESFGKARSWGVGDWLVLSLLMGMKRTKIGHKESTSKSHCGKVLQKFFDNEREDYKKDVAMKTPNYDALQKKSSQAGKLLVGGTVQLESMFLPSID